MQSIHHSASLRGVCADTPLSFASLAYLLHIHNSAAPRLCIFAYTILRGGAKSKKVDLLRYFWKIDLEKHDFFYFFNTYILHTCSKSEKLQFFHFYHLKILPCKCHHHAV